jgi:hypothetical protein
MKKQTTPAEQGKKQKGTDTVVNPINKTVATKAVKSPRKRVSHSKDDESQFTW